MSTVWAAQLQVPGCHSPRQSRQSLIQETGAAVSVPGRGWEMLAVSLETCHIGDPSASDGSEEFSVGNRGGGGPCGDVERAWLNPD